MTLELATLLLNLTAVTISVSSCIVSNRALRSIRQSRIRQQTAVATIERKRAEQATRRPPPPPKPDPLPNPVQR